jgi:hypothetical protein
MLETLGITRGENHLGAFSMCTACRFESNARATADHNKGLAKKSRFVVHGRGDSYGAHGSPLIRELVMVGSSWTSCRLKKTPDQVRTWTILWGPSTLFRNMEKTLFRVKETTKFLRLQTLDFIFECNGMTLSSI